MAADDKSNAGGGDPNQGGVHQSGRPVKKERSKTMDTQSLKALAPGNEVARSALEMRQNLEKFMPPGPQRDQLIAQLKEDVTPLLSQELEAKQAQQKQTADQSERDRQLNDAIDRAARHIKDKLGQFETFGPVKEVTGVRAAGGDHMRAV